MRVGQVSSQAANEYATPLPAPASELHTLSYTFLRCLSFSCVLSHFLVLGAFSPLYLYLHNVFKSFHPLDRSSIHTTAVQHYSSSSRSDSQGRYVPDLYDIAIAHDVHDLARVSWDGYVQYRSCRRSHKGMLGSR